MNDKQTQVLARSITAMKKKGVGGVKIELEANMDRLDYDSDWEEEYKCLDFLMSRVAELTDTSRSNSLVQTGEDDSDHSFAEIHNPFSWLTYMRFYNDGSVDSELTFTVSFADESNVQYIPKVLEAFKELGANNPDFEVSGAGMHMALLFNKRCNYPIPEADEVGNGVRLSARKLKNFQRSMTQLLPALFFLGSSNDRSREMLYRRPRISIDPDREREEAYGWRDSPKYSAIAYRLGSLEFRVFETCYDRPTIVLDNLVVIANCLQYLRTTYKSPSVDKIASSITFGNDENGRLDRLYITADQLDVLNLGLNRLKPSYMTITELKQQRGFSKTKSNLGRATREAQKQAEREYEEYVERFNWNVVGSEAFWRGDLMNDLIRSTDPSELQRLSRAELEARIESRVQQKLAETRASIQKRDGYITNRLQRLLGTNQGDYTLNFN